MKGEVEEPDFAAKTARFAQEIARVVVCGIAVARGSLAENSLDLLPHVEQVSLSSQAVLQCLSQYAEVEAPMSPLPVAKAFKFSTGAPSSPLTHTLMPPTPFKSGICVSLSRFRGSVQCLTGSLFSSPERYLEFRIPRLMC